MPQASVHGVTLGVSPSVWTERYILHRGGGGQHGQEGGTPDGSSRSLLTGQLQNRPQVLVEHLPYAKERPEHWGYGGQQDKFIV